MSEDNVNISDALTKEKAHRLLGSVNNVLKGKVG